MKVTVGTTLTQFGEKYVTIDFDPKQFRHGWLLGKSGTGKSTLLRNLIVEQINAGNGVAVFDPHGDLIYDCFNYIPEARLKDVIYIDPENDRIPDIGVLRHPDKKKARRAFMAFIQAHARDGWGPETARILRNLTRATLDTFKYPSLIHIYQMLVDDDYAKSILSRSKNRLTKAFYKQYFVQMKKNDRVKNFSHPLNKIEELMEEGLGEFFTQKKSLNFRKIMDEQKIVFIRVSKTYLEERDASVLGAFFMMKFKIDAARRKNRKKKFFIFADEVHTFLDGIDFEGMLAESRKFGTHYVFATQTTVQMRDEQRKIFNDRIAFGNCSHVFAFRASGEESQIIAKDFASDNIARPIARLPQYTFIALTMSDNEPHLTPAVTVLEKPKPRYDLVPARRAIAWARGNTGTPKEEIDRHLDEVLSEISPFADLEPEEKEQSKSKPKRTKKKAAA